MDISVRWGDFFLSGEIFKIPICDALGVPSVCLSVTPQTIPSPVEIFGASPGWLGEMLISGVGLIGRDTAELRAENW